MENEAVTAQDRQSRHSLREYGPRSKLQPAEHASQPAPDSTKKEIYRLGPCGLWCAEIVRLEATMRHALLDEPPQGWRLDRQEIDENEERGQSSRLTRVMHDQVPDNCRKISQNFSPAGVTSPYEGAGEHRIGSQMTEVSRLLTRLRRAKEVREIVRRSASDKAGVCQLDLLSQKPLIRVVWTNPDP
jgi:hypothetical protein